MNRGGAGGSTTAAVPSDTLTLARKLEAAGFPPKQAQDTAAALTGVMSEQVATKHDLEVLEHDLTMRLGALMAASIGVVAVLVRPLWAPGGREG